MSGQLKETRERIASVQSTQQITKAMKMVSAAKLRRAQDAIIQMRPYAEKLTAVLGNLSASLESSEGAYSNEREVNKLLIVAISSNRGLCGGFNAYVGKEVRKLIRKNEGKEITVMSIGRKAHDTFKKTEYAKRKSSLSLDNQAIYSDLTFENVSLIAEKVMETFVEKEYDKIVLVYNRFKNAGVQILTTEQFLPVVPPETDSESTTNIDYIFDPVKEEIIQELIPKSLKTQFYKALLDSHAAEHGARMTAMDKATENAEELLSDLKLEYNRARQAAITTELTEIVSGAEALGS